MRERDADPCSAHRFRVSCDYLPDLGFSEVRGLSVDVVATDADGVEATDPDERSSGRRTWRDWREWIGPPVDRPRPGHRGTRSPPLELRRGVTDERALWTWLQEWVAGDVGPQDVLVCLLDARGDPVRGWTCRGATPVVWTGPDLVADRVSVATETLELAHDGIDAVTDLATCDE